MEKCGEVFFRVFCDQKMHIFRATRNIRKRDFLATKKKGHIHLNSFSFLQNLFISQKYALMASDI